jgi:hypothetical protein
MRIFGQDTAPLLSELRYSVQIPEHAVHWFRIKATTDSDVVEKLDAMQSEQLVDMARNRWTASIGIDGRHGPDYAP